MIISKAGKISEHITLLGLPESCVYLVESRDESVLIGGGMSYLAPDILRQIRDFHIDEEKIKAMVILHAHFDHCGLIPFLKKRWPRATVMASTRAKALLSDERVSKSIALLNQEAVNKVGCENATREPGFAFTGIEVEEILKEGDMISCGDLSIEIIEVPGHSTCSIAAYLAGEKALFASDAAGVRFKDFIMAAGNSNFDLYQHSLQKMSRYDVEILLAEHYGAALGDEARLSLKRAIVSAEETRRVMEASYRRTGDVKESTEELTRVLVKQAPDGFLGPDVLALVIGQMVRYIAKTMEKGKRPKQD